MKTPNQKELDLLGKCGTCKQYRQWIVKGKETARGGCSLKGGLYKQRTETCLLYEKGNENE